MLKINKLMTISLAAPSAAVIIKRPRLLAGAALAVAAIGLTADNAFAADKFMASYSGNAAFTSPTTVSAIGTGTATGMGRISAQIHVDITGSDNSCPGGLANVDTETLTAANDRDTLTIVSHNVACPTGPNRYYCTGHWTVTDGTGKYSAATGQGTFDAFSDYNTGTFSLSLAGTVVRNDGNSSS